MTRKFHQPTVKTKPFPDATGSSSKIEVRRSKKVSWVRYHLNESGTQLDSSLQTIKREIKPSMCKKGQKVLNPGVVEPMHKGYKEEEVRGEKETRR